MNTDQITGILRAVFAAAGGLVAAKGYTDSGTWTIVSGAAITLIVTIWSIYSNRTGVVNGGTVAK